jgi:K+-sensing histidine kinase KdpD
MDARLAAIIVHDIKNALGVLEGELHTMTVEPTRVQALQAHGTCASLREKLIGFLTLYKASSQGLTPHIEGVNPEDFLRGLLRTRITSRPELNIEIDTRDMPALAFFDENLIGLALEAALQNATRFARSSITVGCIKQASGDLAFTIHDDGPGLAAKEVTASTGLGMELCRAIAQAHRRNERAGNVSLIDHPQGGALFTLSLP